MKGLTKVESLVRLLLCTALQEATVSMVVHTRRPINNSRSVYVLNGLNSVFMFTDVMSVSSCGLYTRYLMCKCSLFVVYFWWRVCKLMTLYKVHFTWRNLSRNVTFVGKGYNFYVSVVATPQTLSGDTWFESRVFYRLVILFF